MDSIKSLEQKINHFVFIYVKDNKVKVFDLETSKELHDSMIKQGYKHIATLDPCKWIEFIINQDQDKDIISEVRGF
jgi:hypothetical protein